MKELLERLRGATGADREIDEAILRAVGWYSADAPARFGAAAIDCRVTASLDAALALVERVLPGANWLVSHVVKSRWSKHAFWATCGSGAGKYEAYAPTAPLALLIALLGALSGRPKAEDGTVEAGPGTNNNPSLSKPNQ